MTEYSTEQIINQLEKKDKRALAKAITIVENLEEKAEELFSYAYRKKSEDTLVIGITGPGGAGKSTIIDKLILQFREQGKTVGVIAVDPSSPYTGGAVLGDRVRMGRHNTDEGVFVRSLGSRGWVGGISAGTKNVLYLYKAFGFDVIIVESLGVGQDETEVTNFVDVTVVMVVPSFGDEIQMAKAGVQEIADVFVLNKSDKPDAEVALIALKNSLDTILPNKRPSVVSTIASENIGIGELVKAIEVAAIRQKANRKEKTMRRIKMEIESEVRRLLDTTIENKINEFVKRVIDNGLTPLEASRVIVNDITFKK